MALALPTTDETNMPHRSNFGDVRAFHQKFGVPAPDTPQLLDPVALEFRAKFLSEELNEFLLAHQDGDLPKAFDALIDLVYVAMGTAVWMGLPWQAGWDTVQAANMGKVLAESAEQSLDKTGRGHKFDVVKPAGWRPPDLELVLAQYTQFMALADRLRRMTYDQEGVVYG